MKNFGTHQPIDSSTAHQLECYSPLALWTCMGYVHTKHLKKSPDLSKTITYSIVIWETCPAPKWTTHVNRAPKRHPQPNKHWAREAKGTTESQKHLGSASNQDQSQTNKRHQSPIGIQWPAQKSIVTLIMAHVPEQTKDTGNIIKAAQIRFARQPTKPPKQPGGRLWRPINDQRGVSTPPNQMIKVTDPTTPRARPTNVRVTNRTPSIGDKGRQDNTPLCRVTRNNGTNQLPINSKEFLDENLIQGGRPNLVTSTFKKALPACRMHVNCQQERQHFPN